MLTFLAQRSDTPVAALRKMGLDNEAFRKFVDDTPSQKRPKPKKTKPSTKAGGGRSGKPVPKEEDDELKYRYALRSVVHSCRCCSVDVLLHDQRPLHIPSTERG